jgi:hypothetical protein
MKTIGKRQAYMIGRAALLPSALTLPAFSFILGNKLNDSKYVGNYRSALLSFHLCFYAKFIDLLKNLVRKAPGFNQIYFKKLRAIRGCKDFLKINIQQSLHSAFYSIIPNHGSALRSERKRALSSRFWIASPACFASSKNLPVFSVSPSAA